MARENQGLQIALIVFVMLTLILGVTTFVFYRQYDEANKQAAAAQQEKTKVDQELKTAQAEIAELKQILGFNPTDTLKVVQDEAFRDKQTVGAGLPETERSYRKMVYHLNDTVQQKNRALAAAEADKQKLQDQLAARERDAATRIQQHEETVKQTNADLAQRTGKYEAYTGQLNKEKETLLAQVQQVKEAGDKKAAEAQNAVAAMDKKLKTAQGVNESLRQQIEGLTKETFETAHGKIVWVNQRTGRAYINLGEADGLRRLMSFGVFSSTTEDVSRAEKKASIEVVEILGPHQAEARITEDKPGNPIMPGDLVFTPIWSPGKRMRFALAGFIDLDGDGRSDLARVRDIITASGAVIDAYQEATGTQDINSKIVGTITPNTDYLVLGAMADEKSSRAFRANVTKMLDDAKTNLVKQIKLDELLQRMGYREVDRITRLGPGANPADFRPQPPPEGIPPSPGTVSPLFQPRQPPRPMRF